ncbi:hypothetical protein B0H63DRAFT_520354 [Podospora didyma]|uniref:Heterokaryon incompatibility domain-containing protein n=1 Tax=Podospora didyma TaxID=330526 RepID=A0AAE0P0S5_9PEZI|nr:hypothetical protein B0H63DRAFT_520354 [Podospora didyma]
MKQAHKHLPRLHLDHSTPRHEYLWIDSLCIIQSDAQDWAVDGASEGDGECCIDKRSYSAEGVLRMECPGPEGGKNSKNTAVYARRSQRGMYRTLAKLRGGEPVQGGKSAFGQPLDTRAWTFQEELATRILFYTEDELQWRCSQANACECRGTRKPPKGYRNSLRVKLAEAKCLTLMEQISKPLTKWTLGN